MTNTMKRIAWTLSVVWMSTAFAPPTLATDGFASGRELLGWCNNMEMDDIHWGLCVGSITAAHDMVMTYQGFGVSAEAVCTKMTHMRADVVEAVIAYMKANPGKLDYSLGDVVLAALVEKFPCAPSM